ncbi:hypothetical protein IHC92_08845 [Photobacterium damselae subsp. damselae]|uniref:hypothetical protein n=1 Tax=Photobacterium damselae TaxID=38293 RepID=UPI001F42B5ED|nr:hypothetical protein [Photobacterium damselae]UKA05261.1 hypothetical protein IHC90_08850 [Photobacterium damselae subsp. damselae]UKA20367.1 hypothetical protein IHC92_08845 [Photobacterium damselae subsp. damselae]
MGLKRINHYVEVLPKMFVGWRMGEDLETLSELPNGVLSINLFDGTVSHSIVGELELYISNELSTWFRNEVKKENIDLSMLLKACLTVEVDTDKVKTNKKRVVMFNFDCIAHVATVNKVYESRFSEVIRWYTRLQTV